MTTPTNQPSETNNFCSSKHSHEPAIEPQLDAEGRCLICGLLCQIDQLTWQLATAIAERDAWLTKHDKLMDKVEAVLEHNHKVETHNQSITTLCEELSEALKDLSFTCTCDRPAMMNAYGAVIAPGDHTSTCVLSRAKQALTRATELIKKK